MTETRMTEDEHRERHNLLFTYLDELVANYTLTTGNLPSDTTVLDLMIWSFKETIQPTNPGGS